MNSMQRPRRTLHARVFRALRVIAILFVPASAYAQPPEPTWSTLKLKVGEKIIVTDRATVDILRGRILRIADDGLVLADGSTRYTVLLGDVSRVERPKDRIWDGAVNGYAVGFLTGMTLVLSDPCSG